MLEVMCSVKRNWNFKLFNGAKNVNDLYIHYISLITMLKYQNKQKLELHRIGVIRQMINAQTPIFALSLAGVA